MRILLLLLVMMLYKVSPTRIVPYYGDKLTESFTFSASDYLTFEVGGGGKFYKFNLTSPNDTTVWFDFSDRTRSLKSYSLEMGKEREFVFKEGFEELSISMKDDIWVAAKLIRIEEDCILPYKLFESANSLYLKNQQYKTATGTDTILDDSESHRCRLKFEGGFMFEKFEVKADCDPKYIVNIVGYRKIEFIGKGKKEHVIITDDKRDIVMDLPNLCKEVSGIVPAAKKLTVDSLKSSVKIALEVDPSTKQYPVSGIFELTPEHAMPWDSIKVKRSSCSDERQIAYKIDGNSEYTIHPMAESLLPFKSFKKLILAISDKCITVELVSKYAIPPTPVIKALPFFQDEHVKLDKGSVMGFFKTLGTRFENIEVAAIAADSCDATVMRAEWCLVKIGTKFEKCSDSMWKGQNVVYKKDLKEKLSIEKSKEDLFDAFYVLKFDHKCFSVTMKVLTLVEKEEFGDHLKRSEESLFAGKSKKGPFQLTIPTETNGIWGEVKMTVTTKLNCDDLLTYIEVWKDTGVTAKSREIEIKTLGKDAKFELVNSTSRVAKSIKAIHVPNACVQLKFIPEKTITFEPSLLQLAKDVRIPLKPNAQNFIDVKLPTDFFFDFVNFTEREDHKCSEKLRGKIDDLDLTIQSIKKKSSYSKNFPAKIGKFTVLVFGDCLKFTIPKLKNETFNDITGMVTFHNFPIARGTGKSSKIDEQKVYILKSPDINYESITFEKLKVCDKIDQKIAYYGLGNEKDSGIIDSTKTVKLDKDAKGYGIIIANSKCYKLTFESVFTSLKPVTTTVVEALNQTVQIHTDDAVIYKYDQTFGHYFKEIEFEVKNAKNCKENAALHVNIDSSVNHQDAKKKTVKIPKDGIVTLRSYRGKDCFSVKMITSYEGKQILQNPAKGDFPVKRTDKEERPTTFTVISSGGAFEKMEVTSNCDKSKPKSKVHWMITTGEEKNTINEIAPQPSPKTPANSSKTPANGNKPMLVDIGRHKLYEVNVVIPDTCHTVVMKKIDTKNIDREVDPRKDFSIGPYEDEMTVAYQPMHGGFFASVTFKREVDKRGCEHKSVSYMFEPKEKGDLLKGEIHFADFKNNDEKMKIELKIPYKNLSFVVAAVCWKIELNRPDADVKSLKWDLHNEVREIPNGELGGWKILTPTDKTTFHRIKLGDKCKPEHSPFLCESDDDFNDDINQNLDFCTQRTKTLSHTNVLENKITKRNVAIWMSSDCKAELIPFGKADDDEPKMELERINGVKREARYHDSKHAAASTWKRYYLDGGQKEMEVHKNSDNVYCKDSVLKTVLDDTKIPIEHKYTSLPLRLDVKIEKPAILFPNECFVVHFLPACLPIEKNFNTEDDRVLFLGIDDPETTFHVKGEPNVPDYVLGKLTISRKDPDNAPLDFCLIKNKKIKLEYTDSMVDNGQRVNKVKELSFADLEKPFELHVNVFNGKYTVTLPNACFIVETKGRASFAANEIEVSEQSATYVVANDYDDIWQIIKGADGVKTLYLHINTMAEEDECASKILHIKGKHYPYSELKDKSLKNTSIDIPERTVAIQTNKCFNVIKLGEEPMLTKKQISDTDTEVVCSGRAQTLVSVPTDPSEKGYRNGTGIKIKLSDEAPLPHCRGSFVEVNDIEYYNDKKLSGAITVPYKNPTKILAYDKCFVVKVEFQPMSANLPNKAQPQNSPAVTVTDTAEGEDDTRQIYKILAIIFWALAFASLISLFILKRKQAKRKKRANAARGASNLDTSMM